MNGLTNWGERAMQLREMTKQQLAQIIATNGGSHVESRDLKRTYAQLIATISLQESYRYDGMGMLKKE